MFGSVVSDHMKGAWAPLILEWLDKLSGSMSIQEKIPVKNIEERLASLAVAAASEQALHLCRVVR
jgi:hypothetical protein